MEARGPAGARVAVLGLGIMGSAMARNLTAAGFAVNVWNRSDERYQSLAGADVVGYADAQDAVASAGVVITMLAHGDAVEEVVNGRHGALQAMPKGALWLQMSTVGIDEQAHFAQLADYRAIEFVDAPVLGTKGPAEAGELVVLAAGPETVRPRAAPIFDAIGRRTLWLEPRGAATRLKLVFNSWVINFISSLAETIAFAQGVGVDPRLFLEIIQGGAMDSPYAQMKGRLMIDESFEPMFPLKWAHKDANLVLEAAEPAGTRMEMTKRSRDQFKRAMEQGFGERDMAAVYFAARGEGTGSAEFGAVETDL